MTQLLLGALRTQRLHRGNRLVPLRGQPHRALHETRIVTRTADRVERLGEFHSSPGMVAESFTLVRAHGVRKLGDGGGTEHEEISVHLVARDEIPAFVEARRRAGVAVDTKLLMFLDC